MSINLYKFSRFNKGITIISNKSKLKDLLWQIDKHEKNKNQSLFKETIDLITDNFNDDDFFTNTNNMNNKEIVKFSLLDKENKRKRIEKVAKLKNNEIFDPNTNSVNIPDVIYQTFLDKGMIGNITNLVHNNKNISLISTIYNRIDISNIYKSLDLINPEYLFIQFRPDLLFKNTDKQIELYLKDKLSEDKIVESLLFDPIHILPSSSSIKKAISSLKKADIQIEENLLNKLSLVDNLKAPDFYERLSLETISVSAIWGETNKKKIVMADIPLSIQIKKIINSYSLYEIRDIFKNIFIEFPQNPDFEPNSSLTTAQYLYPNVFLKDSDVYLSNIINYFTKRTNFSETEYACLLGYGQSISLPLYLSYINNQPSHSLKEILDVGKRYKTLIYGDDSLEIITEKLSMLLIIYYGTDFSISKNIYDSLLSHYIKEEMIISGFSDYESLYNRMSYLLNILINEKKSAALDNIIIGVNKKKELFMNEILNKRLI